MADPLSVQLLSFNFPSRMFAYFRLAQGFSHSVNAFGSFMRKYLYPSIVADQCLQYEDDLGTATPKFEISVDNLKATATCIEKAGLKLTTSKNGFGLRAMMFIGNTITTEDTSPNETKVSDFFSTLQVSKTPKQIRQFNGFFQYFRSSIPKLGDKLLPFYKRLRKNTALEPMAEH